MAEPTCPICHRSTESAQHESFFPFCSPRCKLIDLGSWLSGVYRLPAEEDESAPAGPPIEPSSG